MRLPTKLLLAPAVLVAALSVPLTVSGSAVAALGPQWTVTSVSRPTNFAPGQQNGFYGVTVTNTGDAPSDGSPVTITDELPAGLTLTPSGARGENTLSPSPAAGFTCELRTCTFTGVVAPDQALIVTFPVAVSEMAPASVTNFVRVHGGGAEDASVETPTAISESAAGFGISPGGASTALSSTLAGAHPDITTSIAFNTVTPQGALAAAPKDTIDELPPGFAGDLVDTPACSAAAFALAQCPNSTQIGETTVNLVGLVKGVETLPVYNLTPGPGELGKIGFTISGGGKYRFEGAITLRPGDYGLNASFENAKQSGVELDSVSLTVWGVPASPSHDLLRGLICKIQPGLGTGNCQRHGIVIQPPLGGTPAEVAPAPYFTNPTTCGAPGQAHFVVDSWEEPGNRLAAPMPLEPFTGCDGLTIEPTLQAQTSTSSAESATGLDVRIGSPQHYDNPFGVAASNLDNVTLTLPEGMTLNPSAGAGLGACSEAQLAYEASTFEPQPGLGCPSSSKLGTVHAHSPGIAEEASGSIFLATPYANRFGTLLALYIVLRIPNRGVVVTAAGRVEPDPLTGRLTTYFPENPRLPFDTLLVSFRQGQTSPLVTPPVCGTFAATGVLTPWSLPLQEHFVSSAFEVTSGVRGGPCPAGGAPPFHPQAIAGTSNNAAGSYSPFYLRLIREDGEQELTGFSTLMPPGLTGNLTGIPFCPDVAIEAARARANIQGGGALELAQPSCPAASRIGHTIVGAGVGEVLAQNPGSLYLAGPYHGAPLSLVSITSAVVGPFDLGTVVIRFALNINPSTAQVEVDASGSDPIPHIIKGIVTHVRDIRAYIDRPNFILNPTGCERMTIGNVVTGAGADPSNPAGQMLASASSPFQAADCAKLKYSPALTVTTTGRASRLNGTSLTFRIAYPPGAVGTQSWFKSAKFDIPKQLPARLTTIQQACLAPTFETNRAACPPASIIGHALVHTPILPVPLEGPVYFVSYGGAKFPDAVLVLKGYGITIELHGHTFINSKTSVTSATFESLPDVPFESIEVNIPQGRYSEFGANLPHESYNFCGQKLTVPNLLKASNGMQISQSTPVAVTGCSTKLSISSHKLRGNTLTLTVYAPGAGRLRAAGRGVSSASKSTSGIEFVTLTLKTKRRGKFRTKLHLTFAPSKGKHQSAALTLRV